MVKVEIVEEKDEHTSPNSPYASSSSSRTGSTDSLSSVESLDLNVDESVFDRVAALVDIVPPSTRHSIATKVSKTASVVKKTSKVVGNLVWIVTTSALLVVLPLALALEDDAKLAAQEREMLEQQQGAQASPKVSCILLRLTFNAASRWWSLPIPSRRPATTKRTRPPWVLVLPHHRRFSLLYSYNHLMTTMYHLQPTTPNGYDMNKCEAHEFQLRGSVLPKGY
jgi:import receptor subunit TOM22